MTCHYNQCLISILNSLEAFFFCHVYLAKFWPWVNPSICFLWTCTWAPGLCHLVLCGSPTSTQDRLASPLSQWPLYDLLDTSNLPLLSPSFSQLVFSWWPHLLWEKEAIRWEHLCLPIIVSTALPVSASIPSLSSHACPASVVSVPSPPLSLSYCLPLFWTLRASSNSSLDPIIFSNCSISLLIIVKLLKRAIFYFYISTKNVL